jgi:hypothetical protein
VANELSISSTFSFSKSGVNIAPAPRSFTVTIAGTRANHDVQTVGTTTEPLSFVDTVPGYVYLRNTDTTNFVEVGLDTPLTQIFAKLYPGDMAIFPCKSGVVLYVKANSAPVDLEVATVDL